MRQGPNPKRSRGRNNNNNSNNNNNGRRPNMPLRMQTFDSNGPDVRIRGSAFQVHEKYLQLARDASSSGDRIMAESYLQHAEHYYRIIAAVQEQQQQQNANDPNRRYRPEGGYGQDYRPGQPGEDSNGEGTDEFGDDSADAPQLRGDGSYRQQPEQQNRNTSENSYRPQQDGLSRPQNDRNQNDRSPNNDRPQNNERAQNDGQYRGNGEGQYRDRQDRGQDRAQDRDGQYRPQGDQNSRQDSDRQEQQPRYEQQREDQGRGRRRFNNDRHQSELADRQPESVQNPSHVPDTNGSTDDIIVLTQPVETIATPVADIVPAAPIAPRRGRPRRERPVDVPPESAAES